MKLQDVMAKTDWPMLAQQKLALLEAMNVLTNDMAAPLEGLLHWIDAIQDAAEEDGYPVVFLTEESQGEGS